jgi:hypothetical protein
MHGKGIKMLYDGSTISLLLDTANKKHFSNHIYERHHTANLIQQRISYKTVSTPIGGRQYYLQSV